MSKILPGIEEFDKELINEFASIKLVAIDLDGTLIDKNNQDVWDNIKKNIDSIKRLDIEFQIVIATGRTLKGASQTINNIYSKKDLPIILYNGSVVVRYDDYGVLYKKTINSDIIQHITKICIEYNTTVLAYYYLDYREIFLQNISPIETEYVLGWSESNKISHEFNKMAIIWDNYHPYIQYDPSAILIDISKENASNIKIIIERINNIEGISVTSSGFLYIEIRPLGSDKAKALSFVAQQMKLRQENILAIGDNDNDAEMLEWAGTGVTISQGSELAKSKSKYTCKHDVVSGVLEVLRLIKLSKRYNKHYE